MKKKVLNKPQLKTINLTFLNDLILGLQDTKFISNQNDHNNDNKNSLENKKFINRINNIFLSKSNCPKFNYHPLINYSIGKYGDYTLYFNTIFVEISYYKRGKLERIEKTFFHPNSRSFAVNFQKLTFIFYIYYNKVKIYLNFKDYLIIYGISDLKKIRKNCIDLNSKIEQFSDYEYSDYFKLNPFNNSKDKLLGFSCKKNEDIIEVKYGYKPIYLDGFYECQNQICLPFKEKNDIILQKNSLILFEIINDSSVEQMKKVIMEKIKILHILEISKNNIYYFGILSKKNVESNNNQKETLNNIIKDKNFKVYIFECDNYFLGQKISELNEINDNHYIKTKLEKRKQTFDYNNKTINFEDKKINIFEQSFSTSQIVCDSNLSFNTTPTQLQNQINKFQKKEEKKINLNKTLERQNYYFSLFDDDFLYYQMIIQ